MSHPMAKASPPPTRAPRSPAQVPPHVPITACGVYPLRLTGIKADKKEPPAPRLRGEPGALYGVSGIGSRRGGFYAEGATGSTGGGVGGGGAG